MDDAFYKILVAYHLNIKETELIEVDINSSFWREHGAHFMGRQVSRQLRISNYTCGLADLILSKNAWE